MGVMTRCVSNVTPRTGGEPTAPAELAAANRAGKAAPPRSPRDRGSDHFEPARHHHPGSPTGGSPPGHPPPVGFKTGSGSKPGGSGDGKD